MLPDDTRARLRDALVTFYRDSCGARVDVYRPEHVPPIRDEFAVTVSLDRRIAADVTLNVSRVFADDGRQEHAVGHVHEDLTWEVFAGKHYHLIDDDMETGGCMAYARDWIEERGGVVTGFTVHTLLGPCEDTLDLSDFSCAPGTGLVIRERDGNLVRVPYLPPRVDVTKRASVPPHLVSEFQAAVTAALA